MSDTCQTPELVWFAGLQCPSSVFFFPSLTRVRHGVLVSLPAIPELFRLYWRKFRFSAGKSESVEKKKKKIKKNLVVACHHRSGHWHNADLRVLWFFFSASRCCYCCSAASFSSYFCFIFFSSFFLSLLFILLSLVLSAPTPWELNSFLQIDTLFKELTLIWTVKV